MQSAASFTQQPHPDTESAQNQAMQTNMRTNTSQQPMGPTAQPAAAREPTMGPQQARPAGAPFTSNITQGINLAAYLDTANIRDPPQQPQIQQTVVQQAIPAPQAVHINGQEPLTSSMLADANISYIQKKHMLGERLYPVIRRWYPEMAGKVTGMLLEIDDSELLYMLEHHESLKTKVEEKVAVLRKLLASSMLDETTEKQMLDERLLPSNITQGINLAAYLDIANTRNPPQQPQIQTVVQQAIPAPQTVHINGQEPLTSSMLADANISYIQKKHMLGERLYPVIRRWHPEMAGKVTGMLLEIDNSELLYMLEHHESLKTKVEEKVAVLRKLLASSMLDEAREKKYVMGERLFPVIRRWYPEMAGKVTGMLLEIDNSELLHILEHRESLKAKVEEAMGVLQAYLANQASEGSRRL